MGRLPLDAPFVEAKVGVSAGNESVRAASHRHEVVPELTYEHRTALTLDSEESAVSCEVYIVVLDDDVMNMTKVSDAGHGGVAITTRTTTRSRCPQGKDHDQDPERHAAAATKKAVSATATPIAISSMTIVRTKD